MVAGGRRPARKSDMKILLRVVVGLLLCIVLLVGAITASLFVDAARPPHPVGFQTVSVRNPHGKPLQVAIWYPTDAQPGFRLIQFLPEMLAANGAVAGRHLPLILISHGGGEPIAGRADTALALASAGFVAAVVTHTDDETIDRSHVAMPRWLADRPREIRLTLDYMQNDWPAHGQLDPARVGMFGYSNGGIAALILAGGVPNDAQVAKHWAQPRVPASPIPATAWVHDPGIKAVVLAAPAADYLFAPDGLSHVTAPVQLWNGTIDRIEPYEKNAALLRGLLPQPPELHLIVGAGHFTFVSPCPLVFRWAWFCKETGSFDRAAFHREFNQSVIAFYQRNL
jgi:predicted dienelactone hydrolase